MGYKYTIGILGSGAWGTALAAHLAGVCGHKVLLWSFDAKAAKAIAKKRENTQFLPGVALSQNIDVTTNEKELVANCEMIIYATPSAFCEEMAAKLAPQLTQNSDPSQILILAAKGLREHDGGLLSDTWMEANPTFKNIAVLSGPTFARELAQQKPLTATLAAEDDAVIKRIDAVFNSPLMRFYYNNDIIGAQIGGAVKNVIAIAAGAADGLEMGEGFKMGLLCRGVVEMMRYSHHLGGNTLTLAGLSGIGDLTMTATEGSRNYRFGYALGAGKSIAQAKEEVGATIEGIPTAGILTEQGVTRGIDMGVIMAVHGIVNGDLNPKRTFDLLLTRPRVYEFDNNLTLGELPA